MKYRMRKMPVSGKYEIYYLKDYGNGYSREHVANCDTKEAAQQQLDKLNGKEVTEHDNSEIENRRTW